MVTIYNINIYMCLLIYIHTFTSVIIIHLLYNIRIIWLLVNWVESMICYMNYEITDGCLIKQEGVERLSYWANDSKFD